MWKAPRHLTRLSSAVQGASSLSAARAALRTVIAPSVSAARPEVPRRAFSTPVQEAVLETDASAFTPKVAAAQLRKIRRGLASSTSAGNRYPAHASLPSGSVTGEAFTKPVQWKDIYGATVRGSRENPSLYLKGEIELLAKWGSGAVALPEMVTQGKINPMRLALTLHRMIHTANIPAEDLRNVLALLTKLPRSSASAAVFDVSSPITEPWVIETIRAASEATGAFRDVSLQSRMEFVRQLDAEMAAVTAFAQECARDWGFASIRVLHRLYKDFELPHATTLAPLFRQLINAGFHKDVPTSLFQFLESAPVPREAFNVALEAAAVSREPETLRALRALYAASYDLPRDESLPGLPHRTASALIEADQAAALAERDSFEIAADSEALQAYNRAVHEGTFAHWHQGSTPAAAFTAAKDAAVTVSLADHTSPYAVATGIAYSLARVAKAGDALAVATPANADLVFKLPTAAGVAAKFAERRAAGDSFVVLDADASLRRDVAALVSTAEGELKSLLDDVELISRANSLLNNISLQVSKVLATSAEEAAKTEESALDLHRLVELEAEFTALSKEIATSASAGATKEWNYESLVAAARERAHESGVSIKTLDVMAKLKPTARAPVSLVSVLTASVPIDFLSPHDVNAQARSKLEKFLFEVQGLPAPPTPAAATRTTDYNTAFDRSISVAEILERAAPADEFADTVPAAADALAVLSGDVEYFEGEETLLDDASVTAATRLLEELDLQHVVDQENGILVVPKEAVRFYIQSIKEASASDKVE